MVVPTYLAPLPILAKRFLEFEQDLPYFLPMIHRIYDSHSLSVSRETWRKSVYYLDVFWTNALSVEIFKLKKKEIIIRQRLESLDDEILILKTIDRVV